MARKEAAVLGTYIIGDVHGCFDALMRLLDKICYRPNADKIFLTGDLVNRGPKSLEVLRWLDAQDGGVEAVLGNHDLHLLGRALNVYAPRAKDTLDAILCAPDKERLIDSLRARPLLLDVRSFLVVHAGLFYAWNRVQARARAKAIEATLRHPGDEAQKLLTALYDPTQEKENSGMLAEATDAQALRMLTNLRYCTPTGEPLYPNVAASFGNSEKQVPWFEVSKRQTEGLPIYFGHWAELGFYRGADVTCVDSGCVWGKELTAFRVESPKQFTVSAKAYVGALPTA